MTLMTLFDGGKSVFALIALALIASGCISGGSADLNGDFNIETESVDVNVTGENLLEEGISKLAENRYSVRSSMKTVFNTPITSARLNLTTRGEVSEPEPTPYSSYPMPEPYTNFTSTTAMGIGIAQGENSTKTTNKTVITQGNVTEVTVSAETSGNEENITVEEKNSEISVGPDHAEITETKDAYSRDELGVSAEAIQEIRIQEVEILGENKDDSSQIILKLETNGSDLLRNYAEIMEVHGVNNSESTQGTGEIGEDSESQEYASLNRTKTYAWINQETGRLDRFAYYVSAPGGILQVRTDIRFEYLTGAWTRIKKDINSPEDHPTERERRET